MQKHGNVEFVNYYCLRSDLIMSDLKTLKDLIYDDFEGYEAVEVERLRDVACEWIDFFKTTDGHNYSESKCLQMWIKHFFNLDE
jgi:hypothetical protein